MWKSYPSKTQTGCDLHSEKPGMDLSIDILGLLKFKNKAELNENNVHVLVVLDRHCRYCKLSLLRDIRSRISNIRKVRKAEERVDVVSDTSSTILRLSDYFFKNFILKFFS